MRNGDSSETSLVSCANKAQIMGNIGTIVFALPAGTSVQDVTSITATQVRLLSVCKLRALRSFRGAKYRDMQITNTMSRLVFGFLADVTSPLANWLPNGTLEFSRQPIFSRVAYFVFAAVILSSALAWMLVGVATQNGVWVLRYAPFPSIFMIIVPC